MLRDSSDSSRQEKSKSGIWVQREMQEKGSHGLSQSCANLNTSTKVNNASQWDFPRMTTT